MNVSVLRQGSEIRYPANLFSATDSTGLALITGNSRLPKLEVLWTDSMSVTIRFGAASRVLMQNQAAFGVKAGYEVRE
jgi:hypothetical protein